MLTDFMSSGAYIGVCVCVRRNGTATPGVTEPREAEKMGGKINIEIIKFDFQSSTDFK